MLCVMVSNFPFGNDDKKRDEVQSCNHGHLRHPAYKAGEDQKDNNGFFAEQPSNL